MKRNWKKNQHGDIVDGSGKTVLIVGVSMPCGNHPQAKDAVLNRDLLFAAPELLASASDLVAKLEYEMTTKKLRADTRRSIEALCAAIAKAEGGAK